MSGIVTQIEKHVPALRRYAFMQSRNAVAADDLVQECLLHALVKANRYMPGTCLHAWLFTIMHNLHVRDLRDSGQRNPGATRSGAIETLPHAVAGNPSSAMQRAINRATLAKPDCQRLKLYLSEASADAIRKGALTVVRE